MIKRVFYALFFLYYFYLIAHTYKSDDDYNIVYRIDRIKDYTITNKHFITKYSERFQEGKFRKKVQFMTAGKLINIKFKFYGSLEAALDRLPNAEVIEEEDDYYIIKAEVYTPGIKMWLLSQGDRLEVLEPEDFRIEMKNTIQNMIKKYTK